MEKDQENRIGGSTTLEELLILSNQVHDHVSCHLSVSKSEQRVLLDTCLQHPQELRWHEGRVGLAHGVPLNTTLEELGKWLLNEMDIVLEIEKCAPECYCWIPYRKLSNNALATQLLRPA